jgi:hypothetical protein
MTDYAEQRRARAAAATKAHYDKTHPTIIDWDQAIARTKDILDQHHPPTQKATP